MNPIRTAGIIALAALALWSIGCAHKAQFGETGPRAYVQGQIETYDNRPMTGLSLHLVTGAASAEPGHTEAVFLLYSGSPLESSRRETLGATIDAAKEQHGDVFLLSAGGVIPNSGDAASTVEAMNELGYSLFAITPADLAHIDTENGDAFEQATFALLGANIENASGGRPVTPYTVLETREGHTIAVLGLTAPGPAESRRAVTDPIRTAQAYEHLADKHDACIALTNLTPQAAAELASSAPRLDVIIAGQTEGETATPKTVNGVLVAHVPEQPASPAKLVVTFENGLLVNKAFSSARTRRP